MLPPWPTFVTTNVSVIMPDWRLVVENVPLRL